VGELGMKEIWMRRTENKSEKRILEFWNLGLRKKEKNNAERISLVDNIINCQ
jgi:hypothetical protein